MLSRPHVECFYRHVSHSGDVVASKGLLQHPFVPGELNVKDYGWVAGLGSKKDCGDTVVLVEKRMT